MNKRDKIQQVLESRITVIGGSLLYEIKKETRTNRQDIARLTGKLSLLREIMEEINWPTERVAAYHEIGERWLRDFKRTRLELIRERKEKDVLGNQSQ